MSEVKMSEVSNTGAAVELDAADIPAYCPHKAMPLWSSHPRVYLDLAHSSEVKCPYCGTLYRLKPGAVIKAH